MKYTCVDIPHPVPESVYLRTLEKAASLLSDVPGVKAVFQVGGISTPGISDLDMVIIFQDDVSSEFNIHTYLSEEEKYLFIHRLYGCSEKLFLESQRFSFLHNYKLLAGTSPDFLQEIRSGDNKDIKKQLSLEYMLKMYVNLIVQKEYRIINVRSLLLHSKALIYDLENLNMMDAELNQCVNELMEVRNNWFNATNLQEKLIKAFEKLSTIFPGVLKGLLKEHKFFVSGSMPQHIAKNISLSASGQLSYTRKGLKLPGFPAALAGKKYVRLLNRMNSFSIFAPLVAETSNSDIREYFQFLETHRQYNRRNLPNFYPLASSLLA